MGKISSIEEVPKEYVEIRNLLSRISKDDWPTLELTKHSGTYALYFSLQFYFHDELQQRCGEILKKSLQAQFSTPDIWDCMIHQFLEQVDSSSSTRTVNSIVHHSYSTQTHENSTQVFAGFLLRLSIRLLTTQWFGILWELYHDDLDELEIQFLRFYRKRDHDVRTELKKSHDSDTAISSPNNFSHFVKSLFLAENSDQIDHKALWFPQADEFEVRKLEGRLMTKFGNLSEDSLSFSDFCVLLTSISAHYSLEIYSLEISALNNDTDPIRHVRIATAHHTTRGSPKWPLPSTIGLNAIFESHLILLDSKIDCMIKKFFANQTRTVLAYDGDSLPYPEQLETVDSQDRHWAFYALPGCGKTRSIEILLSRNWGFIFTAGSLPVTENDTKRSLASDSNIYDPRREGYSKDLYYLWMTINTCFQMFPGDSHRLLGLQRIEYWREFLVYSRILVFERFLSIAPQYAEPADWLEFQRDYDPFSPLFWLFVLQLSSLSEPYKLDLSLSTDRHKRLSNVRQILGRKKVRKVFVALDEAQHDLDAKFCSEISPAFSKSKYKISYKDTSMIQVFNGIEDTFESLLSGGPSQNQIQVTKIYSGTSLRLDEMMAYLQRNFGDLFITLKVHSNFPLLRSEKEFKRLLDESKFNGENGLNPDQLELIERCGRRLRGRYLWSTLYIDQLQSLKSQGRILDEAGIQEAASDVASRAKGDLKERLTRLYQHSPASQKTQRLLDHLCWIVVNCDLFDRPKTIALKEYEALVDQGFAVVSKESATKGTLEESLAMEAALEWFRTNQPELMQRKMHEVLQISVLDDSNLGNAAEWFLAFELYNLLQHQEDRLLGSLRPQRRKNVLKQLFKAKPMFEPPNDLDLDPENYSLVIGERIGYNFTGQSCRAPSTDSTESSDLDTQSRTGPLELWEYLGSLRDPEAKPRPTFYFPEHNAGPDLVFALEPINPTTDKVSERILCVVQLKTGETGVDVQKAIMTTDLSQSYLKKPRERSKGTGLPESSLQRSWSYPLMNNDTKADATTKKIKSDAMPKKTKSDHDKMKQELQEWEGRTVIRILIATQQESVSPEDLDAVKRKWDEVNELNDYFVMFGKAPSQNNNQSGNQDGDAYVGDLFGGDFMSLLEQLKSKDTNAVIAARATPEEAKAKKQEREAEREKDKTQESLDDGGYGDMYDERPA